MGKICSKLVNRETVSYVLCGGGTTAVDLLSFNTMIVMGVDYRPATIGAWTAAVAFAFIVNKWFVFRSTGTSWSVLIQEIVPFFFSRLGTGLAAFAAMIALIEGLKMEDAFFCKILVQAVSLILNYVLSKWFIFKKREA